MLSAKLKEILLPQIKRFEMYGVEKIKQLLDGLVMKLSNKLFVYWKLLFSYYMFVKFWNAMIIKVKSCIIFNFIRKTK